jgi:hypothetical protein
LLVTAPVVLSSIVVAVVIVLEFLLDICSCGFSICAASN